jgi:hypothetical protein
MSFLGGLFGGDKGGFKQIPLSPSQQVSDSYLMDLLNRRVQYPARTVVGLSPEEQQGIDILKNYAAAPSAGYTLGENALRDIVAGRDPASSPEFASYREQSALEQADTVNALRRSQQLRGVAAGTPALKQEGQVMRGYSADREGYLANLLNTELNRRANAAPVLAQMSAQEPLTRANAAMQAGGMQRQLSQQEEDALFESLMQTMLAPYQLQAPIAENIMGQQRYAYQWPTQSPFGGMLGGMLGKGLGSSLGGMFGGAGGGLSGLLGSFGGPTGGFTADMAAETAAGTGILGGIGGLASGAGGLLAGGAGGLASLLALL